MSDPTEPMRLTKLYHWKKSAASVINIFGKLIAADYLPGYLYWTSRSYCTCESNPCIEPFMRTLKTNLTASNRLMEKLSAEILPLLPTTNTGIQLADLLDDTLASGDRLWGILLKILSECESSAAAEVRAKAEIGPVEKGKERAFFEKVFESDQLAELTGEFEAWNEEARTEAKVSENRLAMSRYG